MRKGKAMVHVLRIDDTIQQVVGEALEQGGHAGAETHNGLEMFAALRCEFPQATIVTLSLAELLDVVQEAVESQDA